MNYAVAEMMLGYTRINGVVAFNSDTKEFLEITPAVARKLIDQGQLKGLKWRNTDNGTEFMCDAEGWNQQNIPVKTACGKFRPMLNDYPGVNINSMYTVVRVIDTDYRGRLYEIISNKCARVKVTEQNIRELSAITNVAGVWVSDTEVKIADGVVYEDRRASAKEKAVEVDPKEISAVIESSESNEISAVIESSESNEISAVIESDESSESSAVIESGDDFDRLVEEIAREIVEAEEEKRRAGIIEDTTPLLSEEQQAEVDAQVEAAFRAKLEEEKAESEAIELEATTETTEPEATVTEEPTEEEKVESETTESEATTETTEQVNKKNNSSKSKRKTSGKR